MTQLYEQRIQDEKLHGLEVLEEAVDWALGGIAAGLNLD
jgi:hypothetical protein